MITNDFESPYEISCDFCSTGCEEIYAENWDDMLAELRDKDWKSFKDGNEWKNQCPDCIEEEFEEVEC